MNLKQILLLLIIQYSVFQTFQTKSYSLLYFLVCLKHILEGSVGPLGNKFVYYYKYCIA
uniref:Uncharacterized protein n=1 Tax=Anguilla anguilla TaxID=7936 RepID=A0A0E9UDD9_ANGAN